MEATDLVVDQKIWRMAALGLLSAQAFQTDMAL